jgi:hypothetical protein
MQFCVRFKHNCQNNSGGKKTFETKVGEKNEMHTYKSPVHFFLSHILFDINERR